MEVYCFSIFCTSDDVDLRILSKKALENKECSYFYTNHFMIIASVKDALD